MPSTELLKEADRIMVICNACRYCEGFCAVFPAMERRRTFSDEDLVYLANLCHNCRGCFYACQYAPPHEFDLNCPKVLQELRVDTYRDFTWPGFLSGVFKRNGLTVALVTLVVTVFVVLFTLLQDPAVVFAAYPEGTEGSFYAVIPYAMLVVPAMVICLWVVLAFVIGGARFWRSSGGELGEFLNIPALFRAIVDAFRLRYLEGGGHGCNYPEERFSFARYWFHHLTFYGFLLCFAATTTAAIYEHWFHWIPPYPYFSLPVVLGTVGGVGLLIGTAGLFWYKWQSDPEPANSDFKGMDLMFSALLFLTAFTGLLLLALRATSSMGMLLAVHFGLVLALFLTLPYSKLVHAIYRYLALVRNALEEAREAPQH